MELAGKHIVLGVTGGIAAYKAAELVRLLVREGAAVQVVMTEAATRFVTPVTFQALSGRPVFTDQWDPRVANNMAHIDLSRQADALLVAPASADFLAKLANGLADDLLTTLVLARLSAAGRAGNEPPDVGKPGNLPQSRDAAQRRRDHPGSRLR